MCELGASVALLACVLLHAVRLSWVSRLALSALLVLAIEAAAASIALLASVLRCPTVHALLAALDRSPFTRLPHALATSTLAAAAAAAACVVADVFGSSAAAQGVACASVAAAAALLLTLLDPAPLWVAASRASIHRTFEACDLPTLRHLKRAPSTPATTSQSATTSNSEDRLAGGASGGGEPAPQQT